MGNKLNSIANCNSPLYILNSNTFLCIMRIGANVRTINPYDSFYNESHRWEMSGNSNNPLTTGKSRFTYRETDKGD